VANVPAMKNMMVESVIVVMTNTTIILIALVVNASQATPKMLLIFAMKKMATAHAQKVIQVDNVMNVKLVTLAIQTAKNVTVNLNIQKQVNVIKIMEHAIA
jgi:hypothetical protein